MCVCVIRERERETGRGGACGGWGGGEGGGWGVGVEHTPEETSNSKNVTWHPTAKDVKEESRGGENDQLPANSSLGQSVPQKPTNHIYC